MREELKELKKGQTDLMNNIRTMINEELKRSNNEQLNLISETVASCSEQEDYKFKRRGNEEQHKHNVKVAKKMNEIQTTLSGTVDMDKVVTAKEKLTEGLQIIKNRQKLIKLADSTELGWALVEEYEKNPLAEDSDDEKKIQKAKLRADKTKKEKIKKQKDKNTYSSSRYQPYNKYHRPTEMGASSTYKAGLGNPIPTVKHQRPGRCFGCGEVGHWKFECTKQERTYKLSENLEFSLDLRESVKSKAREPVKSPIGRLKACIHVWKQVSENAHVVDIIENGYKLPLKNVPIEIELDNNKSAQNENEFVSKEIESLLSKGCISKVNTKPTVVNPLTVAYGKAGKRRLVLDCRHINPELFQFRFKYEDTQTARGMFEQGDYVFSFDLTGAYHHIMIHPTHRTYLGLKHEGEYYIFNVLPFGIATAGHVFTKVMKEVVKHWRKREYKILMYLDDGLGGHKSMKEAKKISMKVRADLLRLGFLIAEEKSEWEPKQEIEWLGFTWFMKEGVLRVSEKRIQKLLYSINTILESIKIYRAVNVKQIAGIAGQIISDTQVFGEQTRMRTRYLYQCIQERTSWKSKVYVSSEAENEMKFWKQNVEDMNRNGTIMSELNYGKMIEDHDVYIYTDASGKGFGGYCTDNINKKQVIEGRSEKSFTEKLIKSQLIETKTDSQLTKGENIFTGERQVYVSRRSQLTEFKSEKGFTEKLFQGQLTETKKESQLTKGENSFTETYEKMGKYSHLTNNIRNTENNHTNVYGEVSGTWYPNEQGKSSTWRELEAVKRVIKSNEKELENKKILLHTDNKNVEQIIKVGSKKQELQDIAIEIVETCDKRKVILESQWIPREQNEKADWLSRRYDNDDWGVQTWAFNAMEKRYGKYTYDRFATDYNRKCDQFNSKYWCKSTQGIDAFSFNWQNEVNWMVPPPKLITKTIYKIKKDNAKGTLVVPEWKGAPFWPEIEKLSKKDHVKISSYKGENFTHKGRSQNGIFGKKCQKFNFLAIDFMY